MKYHFQRINRNPVRTWRWLQVNDTSLSGEVKDNVLTGVSIKYIPDGFTVRTFSDERVELSDIGERQEIADFSLKNQNTGFKIRLKKGAVQEEPLVIYVDAKDDMTALVENSHITIEEESCGTVIFVYRSHTKEKAFYSGFCQVHVKENAECKLVKIQKLSEKDDSVADTKITVDKNARADVFCVELGAWQSISGCEIDLAGEAAQSTFYSLYVGDKTQRLDMNYRINFKEKKTNGQIVAKGVLQGSCKKTFRDTLDFQTDATGAAGREEEATIVLSEKARNISVPLLLCAEEDVAGEHASSTGKLDEGKMFYLMSRGLSYDEAKLLLVEGAFAEIIKEIPDEKIREELLLDIGRRLSSS